MIIKIFPVQKYVCAECTMKMAKGDYIPEASTDIRELLLWCDNRFCPNYKKYVHIPALELEVLE